MRERVSASDDAFQNIVQNTSMCDTGSLQKIFLELLPCLQHGEKKSVACFEENLGLKCGGICGKWWMFISGILLRSLCTSREGNRSCATAWATPRASPPTWESVSCTTLMSAPSVAALFGFNDFFALVTWTVQSGGLFHLTANSVSHGPRFCECAPCHRKSSTPSKLT